MVCARTLCLRLVVFSLLLVAPKTLAFAPTAEAVAATDSDDQESGWKLKSLRLGGGIDFRGNGDDTTLAPRLLLRGEQTLLGRSNGDGLVSQFFLRVDAHRPEGDSSQVAQQLKTFGSSLAMSTALRGKWLFASGFGVQAYMHGGIAGQGDVSLNATDEVTPDPDSFLLTFFGGSFEVYLWYVYAGVDLSWHGSLGSINVPDLEEEFQVEFNKPFATLLFSAAIDLSEPGAEQPKTMYPYFRISSFGNDDTPLWQLGISATFETL